MHVRLARRSDPLPTHLDPAKDIVVLAETDCAVLGYLALRPMLFAHTFEISPTPDVPPRLVSEALFEYAKGFAQHSLSFARPGEFAPYGTIFQVDRENERMRRFIESKGAEEEPKATIYRIDITP